MAEISEYDSLLEEWIDALESGKYEQNVTLALHDYLRVDDDFSCLGVLCDLFDYKMEEVSS